MGEKIELTKDEKSAINGLKRIAKKWPESLWLFSASGTLHVMRKKGSTRALVEGDCEFHVSNVDPEYIVAEISIENDGGDW